MDAVSSIEIPSGRVLRPDMAAIDDERAGDRAKDVSSETEGTRT
jgi:hypothetical protein